MLSALRSEGHSKMDCEVDAEPDEENRESNRDHVEFADGRCGEGAGPDQSDEQCREGCDDKAP